MLRYSPETNFKVKVIVPRSKVTRSKKLTVHTSPTRWISMCNMKWVLFTVAEICSGNQLRGTRPPQETTSSPVSLRAGLKNWWESRFK